MGTVQREMVMIDPRINFPLQEKPTKEQYVYVPIFIA